MNEDAGVVNWTRSFSGPVDLHIDQEAPGPVVVTGTDGNEVLVRATKQVRGGVGGDEAERLLAECEVRVEADGETVRIETEHPRRWSFWGGDRVSVALEVRVPTGSSVKIDIGSGRTEVRGTQGPVEVDSGSGSVLVASAARRVDIDSGSGSVTVEEVQGDVRADVGSGSVTVERVHGSVEIDGASGSVALSEVEGDVLVDTASGAVRLERVIGNISIDTGSGSVLLAAATGRNITVDTGSGSISADLDVQPAGRYSFDSGSGRISLTVQDGASFSLSAETGSGSINCSVPLAVSESGRHHLEGVAGGGSASICAETSSGGFSLRSRGDGGEPGGHPTPDASVPAPAEVRAENRAAILKMVRDGKLSAEQGKDLLAALDGGGR